MARKTDPRLFQIAVLSALLAYGAVALDFEVEPQRVVAVVGMALATQFACTRLWRLPRFDPRSALISALSLSLLLRTNEPQLALAAIVIAITSKFVLRWRGKHIFNPTCLAIVVMLVVSNHVWVSAGQWGNAALFTFGAAGLGMLVVTRAERCDVTWAFLFMYAAGVTGRALWLGDPLAIPLHGLKSGALFIFAFFMISDPKTLPDSRSGRLVFAGLTAAGACFVSFGLFRANGPLFALACVAPLTPVLDYLLPARRFAWTAPPHPQLKIEKEKTMILKARRLASTTALALVMLSFGTGAHAFCGFYVAKVDTKLFNRASQVVLVRDQNRTIITMSNDFRGDPREFATVIPVPTFVAREQIHVGDRAIIEHLDAYTSPRLVEYFDPDPCSVSRLRESWAEDSAGPVNSTGAKRTRSNVPGVVIEASYTVGEYDILILSAEESGSLARWLRENGYRLPEGAEEILGSYLKQNMRFFVARVNLEEQSRLGFSYLRPLQVAYESPKFMLPIRLGTLNADGPQELFVYTLTRKGRVETTNYRTVKLPTGMEVPVYVKNQFGEFYTALFDTQVERENMSTVFTEYAWDMNWCDPCAADPLSSKELRDLGVYWQSEGVDLRGGQRDVFVTRLHLRYDADHFPADLVLQETADRQNFQGRYILRHAWSGAKCDAAGPYYEQVRVREEREALTLASLTNWDLDVIREKMRLGSRPRGPLSPGPWWERIWTE